MKFYEYTFLANDCALPKANRCDSLKYNKEHADQHFLFLSRCESGEIQVIGGIVRNSPINLDDPSCLKTIFSEFFSSIGAPIKNLNYTKCTVQEITCKNCWKELMTNDLISCEETDWLKTFYSLDFSSAVPFCKEEIYCCKNNNEKELLAESAPYTSLHDEIERILSSCNDAKKCNIQVTHYSINGVDYKDVLDPLIDALILGNRIKSNRIITVTLPEFETGYDMIRTLRKAYHNAEYHSAIILKFNFLQTDKGTLPIQMIANLARQYQDSVLTIILNLNNNSQRCFSEMKKSMNFTEIDSKMDNINPQTAKKMLFEKAEQFGVSQDKDLLTLTQPKYSQQEIDDLFDTWLVKKREELFPQYQQKKQIGESQEEPLQSLIGLQSVKNDISKIVASFDAKKLRESRKKATAKAHCNMVFYGNPGTAKSTVAKLFSNILIEKKIIEGKFIEVSRSDLVQPFQGGTSKRVKECFEDAIGGILFIDEAYSIYNSNQKDDFGFECLTQIVYEMEEHKNDVIVIMAGYKDLMNQFIESNHGLKSRIDFEISFPDYDNEELYQIFEQMAKKEELLLDPLAKTILLELFEKGRKIEGKSFGNGRFARKIFNQAKLNQSSRIMNSENVSNISDEELQTLLPKDFENLSNELFDESEKQHQFGF